ncbi:MAG: hypothetical protein HY319_03765 [Armatimonadetes bacterium]|nr:hypothetical protein [Armatimonadota bacterium]
MNAASIRPAQVPCSSRPRTPSERSCLVQNGWCSDDGYGDAVEVNSVARSRWFAMRLDHPHAEDALVAAGAALVSGVPSVYVAPNREELPYFLREVDLTYPSQVTVLEGNPTLGEALARLKPDPTSPGKGEHYDTFVGCLMSGLSQAEYAEARSQLQTIDHLLRERVASPHNFCDGIAVKSPTDFEPPRVCLAREIAALMNSDQCVFYQYDGQSRPSGMWVELGGALALGKPAVLFTPDLEAVPPSLREGAPGLRIVEYGSHQELFDGFSRSPEQLRQGHPEDSLDRNRAQ